MFLDPRAILLFAANAILLFLMLMVNSALASASIYLCLLGPMVVFPALYLRHRSYFICTLVTGFWVDAALPTPFGLFTLCFLGVGALIFQMRIRFRAEHNYHPILLAHGLNLFYLFVLAILMRDGSWATFAYWFQVVVTSLASHLILLLIAPWFYNFERALIHLFKMDPEPEDFPIL
jgi:cell shape-determining protein MreD